MKRNRLLSAIDIIADLGNKNEAEVAARLVAAGFTESEAFRPIAFVPMAFSRPVLERLGVTNVSHFVSVPTGDGGSFEARLSDQPEYVASLSLAWDHARSGLIDHSLYERIVLGSAEFDVVNRALAQGEEVEGSAIATALIDPAVSAHVVRGGGALHRINLSIRADGLRLRQSLRRRPQ
jgi:hypothetical protein